MKSVLLVTYHFPPRNNGASIGLSKIAKYLPNFGWQVIVLTIDDHWISPYQYSKDLLNELISIKQIYRTPILFPTTKQIRLLRSISGKGVPQLQSQSLKIRRDQNRFLIPEDRGFLWLPFAIPKVLQLTQFRKIDVIWTTSPPHNIHIIGSIIKKFKDIPWVVDLRDGWIGNPLFTPKFYLRRKIEDIMESHILHSASHITCRVKSVAEKTQIRHGQKINLSIIPNGFDPEDFSNVHIRQEVRILKNDKFTITHTGGLGHNRIPKAFFEAIRIFFNRCPYAEEKFQFINIGGIEVVWKELASSLCIMHIIKDVAHVSHARAIAYMLASDVLWLLQVASDGGNDAIPGKAYEYLAANKPILGSICHGATYDFLSSVGLRTMTMPDNVQQTSSLIQRLFMKWTQGCLESEKPVCTAIEKYSRYNSAKLFAKLFDQIHNQHVNKEL